MMKMTALLTAALMSLGYGAYDAKAQATYFGDEPEGVQSFQQDKDAWRRKDGKRLQILQGISDSIGQAALANITGAEQVFCYQITSRPNNYSGYTINGMVVTGFCGVVAPQLQETIKEQFFSTADNIDFVNSEKCIIKPKIMIRWVRGVDFTDMLISAPCYSYSIFYGGKVRTFNFRPGAELVDAIYEAVCKAEGFAEVTGVLDIMGDGYGFLRTSGYLPGENDIYVGLATIRKNGLRKGDMVTGTTRPARPNDKFAALQKVSAVNGMAPEIMALRPKFADLTPVFPDERLLMEHGKNTTTARVIDLTAPIGKGQRGLIVSPPKAGKTTVLKDIAAAITANNPDVHLMYLGIDERPEEATDMERSIRGEVVSSTFDMPSENHIQVAELVIERAKRLVEQGKDVVILLDSITRLARAYNLAQPASGRILSGGVDSTALYPPKRFLGAARNIENGGSLTILASALIETGSKMDEVIFEEFKGTGNMELKLDRYLADRRIFPAIDPISSGTRKEELLMDPQEAPLIWGVRRILANTNSTERAMDMLIKSLKQTNSNQEFLLRMAKKMQAQQGRADDGMEL